MSLFCATGIGPITGFLPTMARQLGYSITTYGTMMTFISIMSMIVIPLLGIINDKFPVKRILFVTALSAIGIVSVAFVFVPKMPSETIAMLKCDKKIVLIVEENNGRHDQLTIPFSKNHDESISCQVFFNSVKIC